MSKHGTQCCHFSWYEIMAAMAGRHPHEIATEKTLESQDLFHQQ